EELKEVLRRDLKSRLAESLQQRLRGDGLGEDVIAQRVNGLRISFEPADIVNQVMSFGAPTPVEIAVSSSDLEANRVFAEKVRDQLTGIPSLRDLQFGQPQDYPTVDVVVDRERLGLSGGTIKSVADSVLPATSSSRYMVPIFWPDSKTGI